MRLSKARKACVTTMMKDTIFEAASSLLEQHGSDALTMNQVATKVGFATASLYNYFQDKDDLLHFCYSRLVEPCLQAIEEAAGADLPATAKTGEDSPHGFGICRQAQGTHQTHGGDGLRLQDKKGYPSAPLADSYDDFRAGNRGGFLSPARPHAYGPHVSRVFVGVIRFAGQRRVG